MLTHNRTIYGRFCCKWNHASPRRKMLMYLGVYSAAFMLLFLLVYAPMFIKGKTFIWGADGRTQHYPTMVYLARSIRKEVLSFLHGDFRIPQFDLNMGLGESIISIPASIGMLDPLLVFVSIFVPTHYSEYLYNIFVYLWLYIAGLSFSYMCFLFQKRKLYTIIGVIVYCFCGFAIIRTARSFHFFIMGMLQLPLLVAGAYRIMKDGKPWLFIAVMFWATVNKYYSLYMMAFMVAVFVTVTFFCERPRGELIGSTVRRFSLCIGKIVCCALVGICLAGVVILPSALDYIACGRSGGFVFDKQPLSWYRDSVLRFFANGGENDIAIAAIVFPAIVCLFCGDKKRHRLRIIVAIAVLCYFSTVAGWVLCGFQYTKRRWMFGTILVLAYAVVDMMPELLHMKVKQWLVCIGAFCIYSGFVFLNAMRGIGSYAFLGLGFIGITLVLLAPVDLSMLKFKNPSLLRIFAVFVLVIWNVQMISYQILLPTQNNLLADFQSLGFENTRLETASERYLEPYYRSAPEGRSDGTNFYRNTGMVWRIPTSFTTFSSIENTNVLEFWTAIRHSARNMVFNHYSTEHRTVPLALLSNKYYVANSADDFAVPYGYEEIETTEDGHVIYENMYALPWGYTYDTSISYEELEALDALDRQNAMLQTVAVEQSNTESATDLKFERSTVPCDVSFSGCKWEDGVIDVTSANAVITVTFDASYGQEHYLRLYGFDLNDVSTFNLTLRWNGLSYSMAKTGNDYARYWGITESCFNLGSKNEGKTVVKITIKQKGQYDLEGIGVETVPFNEYEQQINALRAEPLENIQWGTNEMTGTVDLSKDKILCVSVPYSKGWSATVDGEEVEILRGNYMFMCLPLTAGHHDIEFHYCSPGIKLGAVLTVCSAGVVIWMLVRDRKRRSGNAH